ncbi:hypothetical protein B4092_4893 [Bacillus licheniformis]|uniref:hypothetical protein n=1 Tax=Bacillus licheniformis TaxID=1402 RepID=UPI00077909C8|nr:hypothetical protein [Bacillus licheniformis]KYC76840.1 hypothetical protein B4092_4893 [Bacillus licheniformis]
MTISSETNPYTKVCEAMSEEDILIVKQFNNSLYHPSEQFEIKIDKDDQSKMRGIVTVPMFTDETDFTKAVRLAKCYALYKIAKKHKGFKRGLLFSDSYISNHIRDIYSWRECEKILWELGIIGKPLEIHRPTIISKVFNLKYISVNELADFRYIVQETRNYYRSKHSIGRILTKFTRPILNLLKNAVRLYLGFGLLVILARGDIPLPFNLTESLQGMSKKEILDVWWGLAALVLFFYVLMYGPKKLKNLK